MACTMRNWEGVPRTSALNAGVYESFSLARRNTAELLLTPIEYRDDCQTRTSPQNKIPLEDVVVVERFPCGTKLQLTTVASGSFELGNLTANGHDILLAFLQASLRPDRISVPTTSQDKFDSTTSSVGSCLDFDTVQAHHVKKRTAAETWPEKLSRRFGHVVANLTELSSTLCDGGCCVAEREPPETPRDYLYGMDMGEDSTPRARRPPVSPNRLYHLPSGLSVEPEPEFTY